ncbi:hypothetical protein E3_1290 [Rhodococcus phage E3]|uniref:hypothetical protein n=1 Tax=Rhodococcus phage E3 TaxID=1007869 RepID=UPI0002C6B320|nr:hypothetical protein M176_gp136 [Rhodococcus phage E3]AEQ21044.1 hypothetical protein E3_1290 [Rhodococcus phage E3]
MATKRTYHVITPTGEFVEYETTGKEYAFAAVVLFPANPESKRENEHVAHWGIVKKSSSEKGASAIGQTARHSAYLKSFPHAVVPIFHGPAPVAEPTAAEEPSAGPATANGLRVGDIVRKGSGAKTYRVTVVHSALSVALQPTDAKGRYFYDADPTLYRRVEGAPVIKEPAVENEAPAEPVAEEALIAHTNVHEFEVYIYRGTERVAVVTAETTFTNDKTSTLRLSGWEVDGEWQKLDVSARRASVKEVPITEVPIGADVHWFESDEEDASRGYIVSVKPDSKYDADPLVVVQWEGGRSVEYFEDLVVLPTFYSYNRVLEIAGEKDADGWRHATITLRDGDTAADPGSTKKGFAGKGTIEYHIHPTSLDYRPSEGVRSIYLR